METPVNTVNKSTSRLELAAAGQASTLRTELGNLASLTDGWADESSQAINRSIIDFVDEALAQMSDEDLKSWTIFPDRRGFVAFNLREDKLMAGITVTPDEIIYFAKKQGEKLKKGVYGHVTQQLIRLIRLADVEES